MASLHGLNERLALFHDKDVNCFGRLIAGFGLVHLAGDLMIGLARAVRLPLTALVLRDDGALKHGSILIPRMGMAPRRDVGWPIHPDHDRFFVRLSGHAVL